MKLKRFLISLLLLQAFAHPVHAGLDDLLGCLLGGGNKMPKTVDAGFKVKVPRTGGGTSEGVVLKARDGGKDLYVEFDDPNRGISHKWVLKSNLQPAPEAVPPPLAVGTRVVVYRTRNNKLEYGTVKEVLNGGYKVSYEDGSGSKPYDARDVRPALSKDKGAATGAEFDDDITQDPRLIESRGAAVHNGRPQGGSRHVLEEGTEHVVTQTARGVWEYGQAAAGVLAKRGRSTPNEDSVYVMKHDGVVELGVVDGMGGYGGGDIASKIACQTITDGVKSGYSVKRSILDIPGAYERNMGIDRRFNKDSGVVLVTASVHGNEITFQSVGDSKGAVFTHSGNLVVETPERSLGAEQQRLFGTSLKDRDKSRTHGHIDVDGVSTKGKADGAASIDTTPSTLHQGDWVVLASDGIWDNLTNEEVGRILRTPGITAREATERIRDAALEKGYKSDDIGIVVYEHR